MHTLFVTGTDTGVGKTFVSCLLLRQLRERGLRAGAYKPACSGAEVGEDGSTIWSDVDQLRAASHGSPSIELVCPQRFLAPLAPSVAARLEHRAVDDALLTAGMTRWNGLADFLLIEGAGGLLSPLSDHCSNLDLAVALNARTVVVAANRLGVINHTRLTVEAIQARGLSVAAVILNEVEPAGTDLSRASNAIQLAHWLPEIELLRCDYQADALQSASGERADATTLFST